MDDNRIDKAAAFDTLFTNNRIQILKTLAYYIDPHLLKGLAVYIKFLELQYTLALFRKHPETALHSFPLSSDGSSLAGELCSDLMPLCDETQKASLQQVTQPLNHDAAAGQHIAELGDIPPVFDGTVEGLGETGGNEHGEIGVAGTAFHLGIGMAVDHGDAAFVMLFADDAARIHAEGAYLVFKRIAIIHHFGFI